MSSFQGQRGLSNEERFESKFSKSEGCWEWLGWLDEDGYGVFWDSIEKKSVRAHRYSYEREFGPLKKNFACHSCDNPKCVRPSHLFAGTNSDNMEDKAAKSRTGGFAALKGERHTQAILSENDVIKIKELLKQGLKQKEIATQFGVKQPLISRINAGKIWKHVTN